MKNNRVKGNNWERILVNRFKEIGYIDACTSRAESRNMDAKKVDLCNTEPWRVQAKNLSKLVDYVKVLNSMPQDKDGVNVICHKKTRKRDKNFVVEGEYAILKLDDFFDLLNQLQILKRETVIIHN